MILCSFIQPTTTLIEAAFNTTPLNIYSTFFHLFILAYPRPFIFLFLFFLFWFELDKPGISRFHTHHVPSELRYSSFMYSTE